MLLLISYIGDYVDGPIAPRAFAFGALVAFGPLCSAVSDAHTFANGWLLGTKLRAYLAHAISHKALRLDASATEQSTGQMVSLTPAGLWSQLRLHSSTFTAPPSQLRLHSSALPRVCQPCALRRVCAQVNLLAVDTNNIVNFCPGGAWVLLEGMQLALTLGALYLPSCAWP